MIVPEQPRDKLTHACRILIQVISHPSRKRQRRPSPSPSLTLPALTYNSFMRIASITAGAAGMYCGSCLHDNALASALHALGHDALLVPTYTPIRTDEPDVSEHRVFLGGLNVYFNYKSGLFRRLPRFVHR